MSLQTRTPFGRVLVQVQLRAYKLANGDRGSCVTCRSAVNHMRPSIASPVICLVVCVVVGNMVMTTGCRPKNRRYTLRGQVMRKNAATTQVTVNGDEVPGFMAAMTMPYKVHDPGQLQKVEAGDMISADLIVTSDENDYWLENIRVLDSSRRKP